MSVQSWFNRVWYSAAEPPAWLKLLSGVYAAALHGRRWAHALRAREGVKLACPVIVVGNVSVGGTGKTPLVCWLVTRLAEQGYKLGVVTRGYGGRVHGTHLVRPSDAADLVGDEPLLLSRRTRVPVAVGRDRPAAAKLLLDAGCDLIISDDGLQHLALARDCEIAVIDGERGFGNGRLLPAGPLREGLERLRSVDALVINGGRPQDFDACGAVPTAMRLEGREALSLLGDVPRTLESFAGQSVHAVAGIGNPGRFFSLLASQHIKVLPHPLPDHAPLEARDLEFGDALPVLMTEKDAVKCARFARAGHWYVPVNAVFDAEPAQRLMGVVLRAIHNSGRGRAR